MPRSASALRRPCCPSIAPPSSWRPRPRPIRNPKKTPGQGPLASVRRAGGPASAPVHEQARRTSHAASHRAGAAPLPRYGDDCNRGMLSTTRRCRRSARARPRARCGCPASPPPEADRRRSSFAHKAARYGACRPRTRRADRGFAVPLIWQALRHLFPSSCSPVCHCPPRSA